jgi:ABC-type nickel/cobalt efflux system permease component RcnA
MAKKTQTAHEPTPDEVDHAATGELHHPGDVVPEPHGPDDHGEADGHDDHAHETDMLGPVDTAAWGAFVVGIAAGLLVALVLVLSTSVIGA